VFAPFRAGQSPRSRCMNDGDGTPDRILAMLLYPRLHQLWTSGRRGCLCCDVYGNEPVQI